MTLSLLPFVVVAHLLGGFSLFALLVILRQGFAASAEQTSAGPTHSAWLLNGDLVNLRPLAKLGLVVLLIQILLGGWTSANYAALVCHQLPLCEAGWQERFSLSAAMHLPLHHETYEYGVMPYEARMTIHVMHRMGALLSLLVLGSFAFLAWQGSQQAGARKLAILLAGLLLTQICLGLINVIAQLPLLNAVAHNFVAANLFAVMLLWVYLLHRQPTAQSLVATNTMQLLGGRYGNE